MDERSSLGTLADKDTSRGPEGKTTGSRCGADAVWCVLRDKGDSGYNACWKHANTPA